MTVVINRSGGDLAIPEINKRIPANGQCYDIPMGLAQRYSDSLYIIPDNITANMNEKNKKLDYLQGECHSLQVERLSVMKIYSETRDAERMRKVASWGNPKNIKNIDILYPFHFNESGERERAIERLRYSILSLRKQDVNVCVCNTSIECIEESLADLGDIKYIHKPLYLDHYCKPKTINYGVSMLVTTPYFMLSDIDLVYPPTYVKEMKKYIDLDRPKRVIFYNYNMGEPLFSKKFKDYIKDYNRNKDVSRTEFGIAPGNGLIHLESFNRIKGYNTEYIGYGLEDAEFNLRIRQINEMKEVNDDKMNTYHIYHAITSPNGLYMINKEKYKEYHRNLSGKPFEYLVTKDKNWNLLDE